MQSKLQQKHSKILELKIKRDFAVNYLHVDLLTLKAQYCDVNVIFFYSYKNKTKISIKTKHMPGGLAFDGITMLLLLYLCYFVVWI